MIHLYFGTKRTFEILVLLIVLASSFLLAQSGDDSNPEEEKSSNSEEPTDELIDTAKIKIDQDLIYGTSPWVVPDKYKKFVNSEYRREFFRMTGIEYSGLHWKQFVMVYMNLKPEIYVKNYYEHLRLYYSDDEDDDWGDEEEEDSNGDDSNVDEDIPHFEQYLPGTVLLKEHYENESGQLGKPKSITLMIKREEGYDPESGDWEYSQFDTNGKILMEGNSKRSKIFENCAKCHANIKERDYIFTTYSSWLPFSKEEEEEE